MTISYKDRVRQTCTAPSTTNPFDFDVGGGTVTGQQSYIDALADAETPTYHADDTAGNWEVGIGTWSEANNALTRTTILASSNAGAAVTFSGTVTVDIGYSALHIQQAYLATRNYLEGGIFSNSDGDTCEITAGKAMVNGELLEWSGSLSTGNIAGIAADTMYYIYLYDSSGTPTIEASTTAPVYTADVGYWEKTSDATRRLVAATKTKTGSAVFQNCTCSPNEKSTKCRTFTFVDDPGDITELATFNNTTWATASNFSLSGKCPVSASQIQASLKWSDSASAPSVSGGAISSRDLNGETSIFCGDLYVRLSQGVASNTYLLHPTWIPYAATYYHRSAASTCAVSFRVHGWKMEI